MEVLERVYDLGGTVGAREVAVSNVSVTKRNGWNKFKNLLPWWTNRSLHLEAKFRLYTCIHIVICIVVWLGQPKKTV